MAWHPNGRSLLCGTSKGTMHAWDVQSKRELLRINAGLSTFSRSFGDGRAQYCMGNDHCKPGKIYIFTNSGDSFDFKGCANFSA